MRWDIWRIAALRQALRSVRHHRRYCVEQAVLADHPFYEDAWLRLVWRLMETEETLQAMLDEAREEWS